MDDRLLLSSCTASPGLDRVIDHRDRICWMDQVRRCPGISLILVPLPLLPLQANVRCDCKHVPSDSILGDNAV
jgi:hypothetical protein